MCAKQKRTCPINLLFQQDFGAESVNKGRVFLSDKAENVIIADMLVQSSCDDLIYLF